MNTQTTMVVLASISLVLAALLAGQTMITLVYASYDEDGDKDGDKDKDNRCKLPNGNPFPGTGPGGKCPPGLDD